MDNLNLLCIEINGENICTCEPNEKYWNDKTGICSTFLTYDNEYCNDDEECKGNLICFKSSFSCNCPSNVIANKCDCERNLNNEYYWNG